MVDVRTVLECMNASDTYIKKPQRHGETTKPRFGPSRAFERPNRTRSLLLRDVKMVIAQKVAHMTGPFVPRGAQKGHPLMAPDTTDTQSLVCHTGNDTHTAR